MIGHQTEETMPLFAGTEYFVGLTVYPVTKLSPERAVNIARQYGLDRLIVNSSADWGPSDVLSVPKVAHQMLKPGFSRDEVERLVWANPIRFYSQSPNFIVPVGAEQLASSTRSSFRATRACPRRPRP